MSNAMLDKASKLLLWPKSADILNPSGSGSKIQAELIRRKIGNYLRLESGQDGAQIGILSRDPNSENTESPIAIVCEFPRPVSQNIIEHIHRLAWNLSSTPLLLILEPNQIRAWTCCEPPTDDIYDREIQQFRFDFSSTEQQAIHALNWIELISGRPLMEHHKRFKREGCADRRLLSNLKSVRKRLHDEGLQFDVIHDLLARIIFIQYLFHRKDSDGNSALNERKLRQLCDQGHLSQKYTDLETILTSKRDTYNLFALLNEKFNGDLFRSESDKNGDTNSNLISERQQVRASHLSLLADFVGGRMTMDDGQLSLWRHYSFDAIPLEFISSVYEVFVRKTKKTKNELTESPGVVYTPGHIVDMMLDKVLPWDCKEWDVKILDPACGSGIFLVKAYQRLIHRWKLANQDSENEDINVDVLRKLLVNNIFGIDIDSHAVRVASFSLYLTMCDEIDPKHYWSKVKFPRLRGKSLIESDSFACNNNKKYDYVIGNAPWGYDSITCPAENWARAEGWPSYNRNIGPLFLALAAENLRNGGLVAMIQPAGGLLYDENNQRFRKRLYTEYKVDEIINLSALRHKIFDKAISPPCIIFMRQSRPDNQPLVYSFPKPIQSHEDEYRIVLEQYDTNLIHAIEAAKNSRVWTTFMWGGRRDSVLVRKLSEFSSLAKLKKDGRIFERRGIDLTRPHKVQEIIRGRHSLDALPDDFCLNVIADKLVIINDPKTYKKDSTTFTAFDPPQVVIRQSYKKRSGRFRAVRVSADKAGRGAICYKRLVTVRFEESSKHLIDSVILAYNSIVATYFLFLTNGRVAGYRPELTVKGLLDTPLPDVEPGILKGIRSFNDLDECARKAYGFTEVEWAIIQDFINYTLADFKGGENSPGRMITTRENEPELGSYCDYFMRVLKAGFGEKAQISATIFQDKCDPPLPLRMIAFHLDPPTRKKINIEPIQSTELMSKLEEINEKILKRTGDPSQNIFYQRISRTYSTNLVDGQKTPTIYLIKPDKVRYWTRSVALRDADEVAADIMLGASKQASEIHQ